MSTWGLLGHDRAVQAFEGAYRAGRLGHAYLITGVPGAGRRTFAARMAQALRCAQPDAAVPDLPAVPRAGTRCPVLARRRAAGPSQ